MLDPVLRRHTDRLIGPAAARLAALHIRADSLTLSAFLFTVLAMWDVGHRSYLLGLGFLVAGRVFDRLDGAVARHVGATRFGAYLDRLLDLTATAGLAFAFALAEPDRALAAMFLMLALVVRAAAWMPADRHGGLLAQTGDLVGKSEFFVAFAVACVFPAWFSILAYVIGVACFIAAGGRLAAAAEPS
ncbi:MAG: CDP-alcohol phosphatidyltransferase family protein [Rhizomicrobium sp.]